MCSKKEHNKYFTCMCEGGIIKGPSFPTLVGRENLDEFNEITKTLEGPLAKLKRFIKEQESK